MKKKLSILISSLLILSLVLGLGIQHIANATVPGINTLVSVNNTGNGQGGNNSSPYTTSSQGDATISANGRYVVFPSSASNLVSGDTNSQPDIFVRDLINNTTTRVNVSTSGVQANSDIYPVSGKLAAISSNGRYVVFPSRASNLIDGQTISTNQIYMRDTLTNTTTLVSQKSDGTLANSTFNSFGGVSNDGRFVMWTGGLDTNLVTTESNSLSTYVYLADLKTKTFTVLNHTTGTTQYFVGSATMNCDGSLIAFVTKLKLDSNDTDSTEDIYLVDTRNGLSTTGITTSSNTDPLYSVLPSLSCNGDYLVFESHDTSLITSGPVPTDTKDHQYLLNRINGDISLVDTSSSGVIGNKSISSIASVDDKGDVAFASTATNLIDGYTFPTGSQLYLKHRDTGQTELVSRTPGGGTAAVSNAYVFSASLSADGKTVVYAVPASPASNLISSDTNGYSDIFASATGL